METSKYFGNFVTRLDIAFDKHWEDFFITEKYLIGLDMKRAVVYDRKTLKIISKTELLTNGCKSVRFVEHGPSQDVISVIGRLGQEIIIFELHFPSLIFLRKFKISCDLYDYHQNVLLVHSPKSGAIKLLLSNKFDYSILEATPISSKKTAITNVKVDKDFSYLFFSSGFCKLYQYLPSTDEEDGYSDSVIPLGDVHEIVHLEKYGLFITVEKITGQLKLFSRFTGALYYSGPIHNNLVHKVTGCFYDEPFLIVSGFINHRESDWGIDVWKVKANELPPEETRNKKEELNTSTSSTSSSTSSKIFDYGDDSSLSADPKERENRPTLVPICKIRQAQGYPRVYPLSDCRYNERTHRLVSYLTKDLRFQYKEEEEEEERGDMIDEEKEEDEEEDNEKNNMKKKGFICEFQFRKETGIHFGEMKQTQPTKFIISPIFEEITNQIKYENENIERQQHQQDSMDLNDIQLDVIEKGKEKERRLLMDRFGDIGGNSLFDLSRLNSRALREDDQVMLYCMIFQKTFGGQIISLTDKIRAFSMLHAHLVSFSQKRILIPQLLESYVTLVDVYYDEKRKMALKDLDEKVPIENYKFAIHLLLPVLRRKVQQREFSAVEFLSNILANLSLKFLTQKRRTSKFLTSLAKQLKNENEGENKEIISVLVRIVGYMKVQYERIKKQRKIEAAKRKREAEGKKSKKKKN